MTGARTLVLLRHGRTAWNHAGRIQGQLDVDLDDAGRAQAEAVAPAIAALGPTQVWCSDLARTRQTVAPLAVATGLAVRYDARLREFSFGAYEGLSHHELETRDPESYAAIRSGHYDLVRHAEPLDDVRARMVEALHELVDLLGPGETAVAVSHGAAIRVAVGALLGWPGEQFRTLRGLGNCGWAVLERPEGDDALRLVAYHRSVG